MKKHYSNKISDSISFHEEIAGSFNSNYNTLKRFKERSDIFINQAIKVTPRNGTILDLGCGPGVISNFLAKYDYKVIGIDGSGKMLGIAMSNRTEEKNPSYFQKRIPFHKNELELLFDTIICSSLLEFVDDFQSTVKLVNDILKTNGIFIVSFPNNKSIYRKIEKLTFKLSGRPRYMNYVINSFSVEDFINKIQSEGFELLEYELFSVKGFIFELLGRIVTESYFKNMIVCTFRKF